MFLSLALLHASGCTHKDLRRIFGKKENFDEIFETWYTQGLHNLPWMSDERKQKIEKNLREIDRERYAKIIEEKSIQIITENDIRYGSRLKHIAQAPYVLYVRGDLQEKDHMLGIVGSRRSTTYGKKVLERFIPSLVQKGMGIISGGAYGIDSLAHEITLQQGGYTIVVFGSGVDIFYPVQNTALFLEIIEKGGALVSGFPIGVKPEPYHFPIRNEIVVGLSDGILIAEAGTKSGTLITAGLALEHGKDVFAVPGDIFHETSEGTNTLIARGEAKCVSSVDAILEEYFIGQQSSSQLQIGHEKNWENEEQKNIYHAIQSGYNTPDSIGENTGYAIADIAIILSLLEIEGHVHVNIHGKYETL